MSRDIAFDPCSSAIVKCKKLIDANLEIKKHYQNLLQKLLDES
jgi:hypothetical protein